MNTLNSNQLEKHILNFWQKEKIYKFNINSKKKIYSIDTPPPTVSGEMHIGHAFSYSQQDFIARFKRMQGFEVFYPFGTDDNGLPTEKLIQKLKNVKSTEMSRQNFINLCLKTLKEITPKFMQDWKDLGISCDFDIYYSTIDKNSRKISQKSFIELYKKGLIYNAEFPTIWDTEFQTPVAQAELEDKEKETDFTTLKFIADNKILPIATTRPELLPACLAIFVNPEDKRYKTLIGKKAKVPIFNHEVPIIADEKADIKKGTGALMICSYGDKYDVEATRKHKLIPKIIITKDGKLNIPQYKDLTIKQSREKILEELKSQNLVIKQEKIKHFVNVYEKSGKEIEFLPTSQWFIKILDKKTQWLKNGKEINWHPKHFYKVYENWIKGLEWDWSISRERHFGVPIPAWHCQSCKTIILANDNEIPVDPIEIKKKCNKCKIELVPETKVLDTWATSSLSPKIASSIVNNKIKTPYSLRPQGHDIIRTWAYYTIVRSIYKENKNPWKDITISGFVTLGGEKMGKSKGNIIKPQPIINTYGSDALRYWAAASKLGEDMDYQEKDLIAGSKFINKIKNASNFVFLNLQYQKSIPKLEETDRIFLSELNKLIESSTKSFEDYNYSASKLETEKFFWQIFADNYLEIIKYRIYNGTKEEKASASHTLYQSLLTILKLFSPITPFITEEIYQKHFEKYEKEKSIHLTNWPSKFKIKESKDDKLIWKNFLNILYQVRQAKSKAQKSMKAECILTIPRKTQEILSNVTKDLISVTNAKDIKEGEFKIELL